MRHWTWLLTAGVTVLAGCISAAGEAATDNVAAVVVAGDASVPVFDDAVDDVIARLAPPGDRSVAIKRLSAAPAVVARGGARRASLDRVLNAIEAMRPGPGGRCFVFATSHGAEHYGLVLAGNQVLSPSILDDALRQGCGDAPTVVVISGCFSGTFAQPPMARPNRIVLTAARPDRTSFGCGAGRRYTVYDRCFLDATAAALIWQQVHARILACVAREERQGEFTPSEPQAYFGPAVAGLPVSAILGRPRR